MGMAGAHPRTAPEKHTCSSPLALLEMGHGGGSWRTRPAALPRPAAASQVSPLPALASCCGQRMLSAPALCMPITVSSSRQRLGTDVGQHSPGVALQRDGSCSWLLLMLQLAQLPHHAGRREVTLPPSMGGGYGRSWHCWRKATRVKRA